ncbi:MAG: segregation/condensation protein A [Candidatus Nanoarchaeia archaeon]
MEHTGSASDLVKELIFQSEDITWQSLLYELVREEKINPWDIDISILAQEYLKIISKLKELNFKLSGKVILAAAILLKLKAEKIGLEQLLALTNPQENQENLDESEELMISSIDFEKRFTKVKIDPKIPLPRKRKVTLLELIEALKKAIEVEERRKNRWLELKAPPQIKPEIKKINIFEKIEMLFNKIKALIKSLKRTTISFEELLPSKEKKDIIWTLLPLLHLAQQNKVELRQEIPFGKIIIMVDEKEFDKKLLKESIKE